MKFYVFFVNADYDEDSHDQRVLLRFLNIKFEILILYSPENKSDVWKQSQKTKKSRFKLKQTSSMDLKHIVGARGREESFEEPMFLPS